MKITVVCDMTPCELLNRHYVLCFFFSLPPLFHPSFLASTGALAHDTAPPQAAPHIGRYFPATETTYSHKLSLSRLPLSWRQQAPPKRR